MPSFSSATQAKLVVDDAYIQCEQVAKTHYENFTVASFFLPQPKRKHLFAIYAFCRLVDDLGDEYDGNRMEALEVCETELMKCYYGTPIHPYMIALQNTINVLDIPREPFLKLIEANRMDQSNQRYTSYENLEMYCQHSANPVGHIVLHVFGYRDEERLRLSDYTCTALQLTNFWQDISKDFKMNRIYIPLEDMYYFGYSEKDLAHGISNDNFRDLMAFEVQRTRDLFKKGIKLLDTLDKNLKLDVALFSIGGMRILDAIERQKYDVLTHRPTLTKTTKVWLTITTLLKLKLFNKI